MSPILSFDLRTLFCVGGLVCVFKRTDVVSKSALARTRVLLIMVVVPGSGSCGVIVMGRSCGEFVWVWCASSEVGGRKLEMCASSER